MLRGIIISLSSITASAVHSAISPLVSVMLRGFSLLPLLLSLSSLSLLCSQIDAYASAEEGIISENHLLNGARLCTRHLPEQEKRYGIPAHLLTAIAATESGRYSSRLKMPLPWPWTVNAAGRGYYFNSKREAVAAVRRFQRQGISSIDVGCMQVNLHHHPNAFSSVSQAFEPRYNIAYAARFLRENYNKDRSWRKASGSYHSRTRSRGKEYSGKVFENWRKIVSLVASVGKVSAKTSAKSIVVSDKNNGKNITKKAKKSHGLRSRYKSRLIKVSKRKNGVSISKNGHGVRVIRPVKSASRNDNVDNDGDASIPKNGKKEDYDSKQNSRDKAKSSPKDKGQFTPSVKKYVTVGNVITNSSSVANQSSIFIFK